VSTCSTASSERLGRRGSSRAGWDQIRKNELMAHHGLPERNLNFLIQHRASIDEGMKLAILFAWIGSSRQVSKKGFVRLASQKSRIEFLRVHARQLRLAFRLRSFRSLILEWAVPNVGISAQGLCV